MPRWLAWTLAALGSWGVWAFLYRLLGEKLSAGQTQSLSTLGMLPVLLALLLWKRQASPGARVRGALFALAAGVLTCAANTAYYHVLGIGEEAATVVSFTALYPLVTVVLAVLLLGERLNVIQGAGVLLGLLAVYFFWVKSEEGAASPWLAHALIPIFLWGISGLLQKLSTNHISGELSTLWFLGTFVPVAAVLLVAEPLPETIETRTWLLAATIGLSFAVGNYALLAAFRAGGKASIIAPLAALYPLVSVPLAILVFKEKIELRDRMGIILALVAAAALSYEKPARGNAPILKTDSTG
ncbi:MAG TPA: DMT family transporter [Planctomycetota bacterium]|nr:DMT family transporter [Planctomycetota bacterium]